MTGPLADPVAHAVADASQSPPHMKNRVTSSYIVQIIRYYYIFNIGANLIPILYTGLSWEAPIRVVT